MPNKYGLNESIPAGIKREVRRRSKYGCVVCRCGIYQYEHIVPEFKDARKHNPNRICCLCGRCHDKVTRGQLSKEAVLEAYQLVEKSPDIDVPREFFDFHRGEAKLLIGGLIYKPCPESLFQCYKSDIFSVTPGVRGEPGKVNAVFTDKDGEPSFIIDGNEWRGSASLFDLEIVGQRFIVRRGNGETCLILRHEPPGNVIVERLDMRYQDIHLLASEYDFALGRYNGYGQNLVWMHTKARIDQILSQPIGIDINVVDALPEEYEKGISATKPGIIINQHGEAKSALSTNERLLEMYDPTESGIFWPALGFQVAKGCEYAHSVLVLGVCSLEHARKHFFARNRVNVPGKYLPATLNAETLAQEDQRLVVSATKKGKEYLKEPFLVLPDRKGIKEWESRKKEKSNQFVATPFVDDKPGCYCANGNIKLVDSYDGPAIRVRRAPAKQDVVSVAGTYTKTWYAALKQAGIKNPMALSAAQEMAWHVHDWGKHDVHVFTYQGAAGGQDVHKGLVCRPGTRRDFWFRWHDLRHTWASWHVQSGTRPQELGGWSSYEMVLRYAHLRADHLRTAADRILGTIVAQPEESEHLEMVASD